MRRFAASVSPFAPAALLLFAVAAAGLRSPSAWLFFSGICCVWFCLERQGLFEEAPRLPLFFLAWMTASAVFAAYPVPAWQTLPGYALSVLFFYWTASSSGGRYWAAGVYSLAAAASAVFLWQRFSGSFPAGLIGANPNYSAAFCAAAFSAAAVRFSDPGSGRDKLLWGALAALTAAGIAASGSRGAALAAAISAGAGFVLLRRWMWLAGLSALILSAAVLLPESSVYSVLKLGDSRAYARPLIWGSALKAAAAAPFLGWGPGSFAQVFETFKFPYFDGISYYGHSTLHAHSELLNLAAEAGFPAALSFAVVILRLIFRGGKENLPFRLFALSLFIQASVDMVLYSGALMLMLWGSLGFSSGGLSGVRGGKVKAAAAGLCFGLLALSGLFRSQAEATAADPAQRLAVVRRAALASPKDPFAQAREAVLLIKAGETEAAEKALRRALSLEPYFGAARLDLASLRDSAGDPEEACALLRGMGGVLPENSSEYQRRLIDFDAARAAKLEKELCGKKKAGGATAPPRGKP